MFSIIYRYRYSYYNIKEYNNLDQSARGQTDGSDLGVQYVIFNFKKVTLKNNFKKTTTTYSPDLIGNGNNRNCLSMESYNISRHFWECKE